MMTKRDLTDAELSALFDVAKHDIPEIDAGFLTSLQDQAVLANATQPVVVSAKATVWETLRSALGGWAGLGGLATATVAGFWIGYAPPSQLIDVTDLTSLGTDDAVLFSPWLEDTDLELLSSEDL